MDFKDACTYMLNLQTLNLPKDLYYHNINHVKDVYHAAEAIAQNEHIKPYESQLLLTAACYHDAGFLYVIEGHEMASCEIATEVLPSFAYSNEEIKAINNMIMATKVPQSPNNRLEEILADADLDYLGRDDFFVIGEMLFKELKHQKQLDTEHEWYTLQFAFLNQHHYFTQTSKQKRQFKKERNLQIIKAKL